jgi:hypothetical protein
MFRQQADRTNYATGVVVRTALLGAIRAQQQSSAGSDLENKPVRINPLTYYAV